MIDQDNINYLQIMLTLCALILLVPVSVASGLQSASHFVDFNLSSHSKLDVVDPSSLSIGSGVKEQAGYLETPSGNQLFYWYFESQDSPSTDPVLIWLNGGPGCSSLEAVLFENGPSNIDDEGQLSANPWSWNKHANLLYIDNPAGVGYSSGGGVYDTNSAAIDFKNAVQLFWDRNKVNLKDNKLHISGESYAGRYVPVFAEAINTDPRSPIKVSSIMIGNGLVDPMAEYSSYQPMLCGQGGYPSVLSTNQCNRMATQTTSCTEMLERCINGGEEQFCSMASSTCSRLQFYFRGRNPYNIRDARCTETRVGLCYTGLDEVQDYFNQASVKQALGVKASQSYSICNSELSSEFYQDFDPLQPTYHNVSNLLDAGIPVLIYHGDADIVLNWLGGRDWTSKLQWTGQNEFQAAGMHPQEWTPSGTQSRGEVTNYGNFTFLRVSEAGHMVPHDQPESAYYLVNQWLRGDYGFRQGVPS